MSAIAQASALSTQPKVYKYKAFIAGVVGCGGFAVTYHNGRERRSRCFSATKTCPRTTRFSGDSTDRNGACEANYRGS